MSGASGPYARAKQLASEGKSFEEIRATLMHAGLSDGEASMLARQVSEVAEEKKLPPPKELRAVTEKDLPPKPSGPPSQFNLMVLIGIVLFLAAVAMLMATKSAFAAIPLLAGLYCLATGFKEAKELRKETAVVAPPDCRVHRGVERFGYCPSCSVPLCEPCVTKAIERKYCAICEK